MLVKKCQIETTATCARGAEPVMHTLSVV